MKKQYLCSMTDQIEIQEVLVWDSLDWPAFRQLMFELDPL